MKRLFTFIGRALVWLWKHTAAGIAVVLIVAALVVGYRLGRPAPQPADQAALDPHDHADDEPAEPTVYTCSMHPSVRLLDPDAKCPICFMDLIPAARDEGEGSETQLSMSASAAALSRIETSPVGRFFPTAETRLYGKITYDQTAVARLTAWFPGRIERLFVNYNGVPVNAGDHLAELYSPDLLAAFEELRQARRAAPQSHAGSDLVRQTMTEMLTAAREKLRLFGLTPAQIASIENGSFDSDRLTIYSPIGGVVTHLAVREGDAVRTGEPIATIADLSRLWLDLEAYESQLPMLRWGQVVSFTVESHPGEVFSGRIAFIEPIVDDRTRTAAVRVAVDNTDGQLKPGLFSSAVVRTRLGAHGAVVNNALAGRWVGPMHPTIVKDEPGQCDICGMDLVTAESLGVVGDPAQARQPLVIPRSAVLFTGKRSIVYVEVADADKPTYEGRTITLGPRAGDFYIVAGGLREGESVVVNGAFRIDSAMQLAAKPSMMSATSDIEPTNPGNNRGVHAGFIDQLGGIYDAYLQVQERLAGDDFAGSLDAIKALNGTVAGVSEIGLIGEPLAAWRRARKKLKTESAPQDITTARAQFEHISQAVLDLQQRFGHNADQPLHKAFCPMAFDFRGAWWLQRGQTINNPYFGDEMLRCGEIQGTYPPRDGQPADPHQGHAHD